MRNMRKRKNAKSKERVFKGRKKTRERQKLEEEYKEQGRIHGQYQLRTGGQGRKCPFSHFLTRAHGPTDGPTYGPTDGRTKPLIELRVRN